jgi:death-on-curing protein
MALHYGVTDVCTLAAYYGFSLCKNHPFLDGNKRTAHQAMATFLILNKMRLVASKEECIPVMLDLASSKLDKEQLAQWLQTVTILKDIKQKN